MKRNVYGIGETVLDIIFKDNEVQAARPGGSTFNCLVSLGRLGLNPTFVSETGHDKVGELVTGFMEQNGISHQYVVRYEGGKTSLALAFLDHNNDAQYEFFKYYPKTHDGFMLPDFGPNDLLIFGSYFAANPDIRPYVKRLLEKAKAAGTFILYDPNFRKSHLHHRDELMAMLCENMQFASVVRGSDEDFENIFGASTPEAAYEAVQPLCKNLIVTRNVNGVTVFAGDYKSHFAVQPIKTVSTVGAGDNFNAGILYSVINQGLFVGTQDITHAQWAAMVATAEQFSANVCGSYDNYIDHTFAEKYTIKI